MPRRGGSQPGWGSLLVGLAAAIVLSRSKKQKRPQQAFYRNVSNSNDLPPLPYGSLTPSSLWSQQLEELAALVYTRLGYRNVKHTGAHSSTDGGVDVWMLSPEGRVEIVQCKQYHNRVDRGELVEFSKVMRQQHAERGHFWSPNGFTKPAIEYILEAGNIDAYIESDIIALVKKVYIPEIDDQLHRAQRIASVSALPQKKSGIPGWVQAGVIVGLSVALGLVIAFGAYLALAR